MSKPLRPALADLVRALARQSVREHLTQQRAAQQAQDAESTNPVPLLASDRAA